jgi:hypothetical protein
VLHKFKIITPVSPENEMVTRLLVGLLFLGPIFLFRKYLIQKLGHIVVKKDVNNQKKMLRRVIAVFVFGYALIFIALPFLNYLLTFI